MFDNLLLELEKNELEIQKLENEKEKIISNVCGDITERITSKQKELETSDETRKKTIQLQLVQLNDELESNKKQFGLKFNNEQRKYLINSLEKINEATTALADKLTEKIKKSNNELDELKSQIKQYSDNNDFKKASDTSLEADKISENIKKQEELLELLKANEEKLENKSNEEIAELIEKNKNDLLSYEESLGNILDNSASKSNNEEKKQLNSIDKILLEKIEIAEQTNEYKDFSKAIILASQIHSNDNPLNEEFKARFENIIKVNSEAFVELLKKAEEDIVHNCDIEQEEVLLLKDKFQFLSNEEASKYYDRLEMIIGVYNLNTQELIKENHDIKKEKKYSLFSRVSEFIGKPITLIASSKLGYKFTEGRLKKAKESFNEATYQWEKESIKEKIDRITNQLVSKDTAAGLKLYNARNYIRKIKPKLYSGETLGNWEEELTYNTSKIGIRESILKKLEKVVQLDGIKESKERVINVMDQYVELLATGDFNTEVFHEVYNTALNFLHTTNVLSNEEVYAYEQQILLIYNYRITTGFEIYELSKSKEDGSYEIDSIVKYSDLDVNVYRNNKSFILRRK